MGNNTSQWYSCVPKHVLTSCTLPKEPPWQEQQSLNNNHKQLIPSNQATDNLLQAIVQDDCSELQQLMDTNIDLNIPLNDNNETALILAVRLGHTNQVKTLINQPSCDKNKLNIKNCSTFDIALIYAYNQCTEVEDNVNYWEIIKILMSTSFDPICKDAMLYVVRTALKYGNTDFINQLSEIAIKYCTSCKFHELLLLQLHRHQPVFEGPMDDIFTTLSKFTIKLLCECSGSELVPIVNSMKYYLESHWHDKQNKLHVSKKLALYATASGWHWSTQYIDYISRVDPYLSSWCVMTSKTVPSLHHLSRCAYRKTLTCSVSISFEKFPQAIPRVIQEYICLKDVELLCRKNLQSITF
ncbi:uncharacterized protein LOC115229500 [Octopus sinensis]|uniref:Uncharacterized protein LOC115229500 n=1 Tax=Octopus sinensis TaxID=2607531 RepID=A0A6P7TTS5_9MOLL|nr:uncharacterized protein LOC115229500 [Octopus sinensis]XP_036356428.1 uncharacterized protein LOC115229500 [Octopus sinensis]XP_036356429.1 uncharacterized protein LOC115229500 [Octopus sinensis]